MNRLRLNIAKFATTYGIKPATRKFACSRNTVRKWVRVYDTYRTQGLKESQMNFEDATRITTNHPHTLNEGTQQRLYRILEDRYNNHLRIIIAHMVKNHHFDCSLATARKYAQRWGFFQSRHNKSKQKRNLVAQKKKLNFCEKIQVDVKYLTDIPELVPSLAYYDVPKYQITARDVATGMLWYAYAFEKSTSHTALFIQYLLAHLARNGVKLSQVTIQTDGGSEFTNTHISIHHKPTAFQLALFTENVSHVVNPPASPTYNSDVEASHRLIEDELYANLWRYSQKEFLRATQSYQCFFNCVRYNSYKKGTPAQLLKDKEIPINPKVLTLTPRIMDNYLTNQSRLKEVS